VLASGDSRLEQAAYPAAALPIIAFETACRCTSPANESTSRTSALRTRPATRLKTVRDRLKPLIDGGATLERVLAARITAEWDAERGQGECSRCDVG
jgi:hypothetical protein